MAWGAALVWRFTGQFVHLLEQPIFFLRRPFFVCGDLRPQRGNLFLQGALLCGFGVLGLLFYQQTRILNRLAFGRFLGCQFGHKVLFLLDA